MPRESNAAEKLDPRVEEMRAQLEAMFEEIPPYAVRLSSVQVLKGANFGQGVRGRELYFDGKWIYIKTANNIEVMHPTGCLMSRSAITRARR